MKVPEGEEEQPLAWMAILADTPVYSSDGERVGIVDEVLGSQDQDIFHGIEVRTGLLAQNVMIPADRVTQITNRRIETALTAEEIRDLPAYVEEESYQLGFVGLLRRRLGWQVEREEGGPK